VGGVQSLGPGGLHAWGLDGECCGLAEEMVAMDATRIRDFMIEF
jgi:hypothetical protein